MGKNDDIKKFVANEYIKVFKCNNIKNIIQLKGGTTSLVYLIENIDFKKYVIKIENFNNDSLLSIEKNTLWWEAKMLELMEKISVPSPRMIHYQRENAKNKYSYILMTYIEGVSYDILKKSCSSEEKAYIETKIGEICSKISSISENQFFLPFSPHKKFKNNFEFILFLFNSLLNDAKKFNININIGNYSYKSILDILYKNKKELNDLKKLCLVHSDAWDGNILVNKNEISIIDFSDLYFCDELMTFYFHLLNDDINNDFFKGYGKVSLDRNEIIRIKIYRLFVLLKMLIEKEIKNFSNKDNLLWINEKIEKEIRALHECKEYRKVRY